MRKTVDLYTFNPYSSYKNYTNLFYMTHGYSSKYFIIKFSAAVDTLRGLPIRRKLGLNGEPYIKKFFYIRYIVKIS